MTHPMLKSMTIRPEHQKLAMLSVVSVLFTSILAACGGGADAPISASAPAPAPDSATDPAPDLAPDPARVRAPKPAPAPAPAPAPDPVSGGWKPQVSDTWNWQLSGVINTSYSVSMYDIDLFDTPQSTIDLLKSRGVRVVCYFSSGSSENWRPDFSQFLPADMGNALSGWAGERWLDTRSTNVRDVMKARLNLAKTRGCDGVEPDNMDAYTNGSGFPLNATTQLDYNRFLAREARSRGLLVGLKNDVDQVTALEPDFDFAINEQCHEYNECGVYQAFTAAGKPVFNAEYLSKWRTDANERATLCSAARSANIRTLVLPLNLNDSFRYSCD